MMQRWMIGWLEMGAGWRLLSFSGAGLLLAGLLWFAWWHPAALEQQRLEQQQRQQSQRYHQQLRSFPSGLPLVGLQRQTQQWRSELVPASPDALSLADLLDASGAGLEHWHPQAGGGELALQLQWSQFVALLNYLSGLEPARAIPRISLTRESQQLRLVMELMNVR